MATCRWKTSAAMAVILLAARMAVADVPATAPAAREAFNGGEPVSALIGAIADKFGVMVVSRQEVKAFVLKPVAMPANLDQAMTLLQDTLEPQGYGIIRKVTAPPDPHILINIVTAKEAKAAALQESPVSSGIEPANIDVSDPSKLITHLLPIAHAALIASLDRTAAEDKEVTVSEIGSAAAGYTLIISGPAAKVKKAVTAVVGVDKPAESAVTMRMLTMKNGNAMAMAESLNQSFAPNSGMRAVADRRTNTIVVTGPEAGVLNAMVRVIAVDAGPRQPDAAATAPASNGR